MGDETALGIAVDALADAEEALAGECDDEERSRTLGAVRDALDVLYEVAGWDVEV